ncbi:unnamed protein product [Ilex paraguariensis]
MWRSEKNQIPGNQEVDESSSWSDQLERRGRASCDQRETIKTVEIDTAKPNSFSGLNLQRSQNQYLHYQQQKPCSYSVSSPLNRTHQNLSIRSPITPSQSRRKLLPVHSASPRCPREADNYPKAQTPTLRSNSYHRMSVSGNCSSVPMPSYMAATASTNARVRSQSAPRQRPLTPEREKPGSVKKRLSFPVQDSYNDIGIDC